MARAGLQHKPMLARPTTRGRRCSYSCSTSCVHSPSAGSQGAESAKWPTEHSLAGWSGLRSQCSHSRGRDRSRQHQNPSPQCPSWCQSPSPSPHDLILPTSGSAHPWKISTHNWDPQNLGAGHDKMMPHTYWRETTKEETSQVWCRWGVGDNPTLPPVLTLFLSEGMAKEQDDAPSPSTPMPMDSLWLPQWEPPVPPCLYRRDPA